MKPNLIKPLIVHTGLTVLLCIFLALFIFLSSCVQQTDVEEVSMRAARMLFPPALEFYGELMKYCDCDTLVNATGMTGPLFCSDFANAVNEFSVHYTSDPNLDFHPSKISMDSALVSVFRNMKNQNTFGLVFHYGFKSNGPRGNIVYILSKGELVKDQNSGDDLVRYCPFAANENNQQQEHFILLEPTGSNAFEIILKSRFDSLTTAYSSQVKYRDEPLDSSHTHMVYHDAKSFFQFYKEFEKGDSIHLYMGHGAMESYDTGISYHIPCFALGTESYFYPINDKNYTEMGLTNYPFRLKALDSGIMCPPRCNHPITPCN